MTTIRRRISRNEILRGAADILDSGIFSDLTVDALARTLHMSKSTLYKHFASKEELVIVLVEDACATTERSVAEQRPADDAPSDEVLADEALSGLVDIYARHASSLPRAVILQTKRLPAACQERVEQTNRVVEQAVQSVLELGADSGVFSLTNAQLAAIGFMAAARAAGVAAAGGELGMEREEAVHGTFELFLQGLRAD